MITQYNRLWIAHTICILNDAMGRYFSFDDTARSDGHSLTLEQQYERARSKFLRKESPREVVRDDPHARRARCYMELDTFDEVVRACGYDTEAVSRLFNLVQTAISYEKKLYDEFHGK